MDCLLSLEGAQRFTRERGREGGRDGRAGAGGRIGEAGRRGGVGTFEETPPPATGGYTGTKSILCLQRKKFMKLEHKRSHVQLAARNLRGEAWGGGGEWEGTR